MEISDDELVSIIDGELSQSVGHYGGKLAEDRRKALQYYLCVPEGDLAPPEIEGRSTYISPDVANTINWMLPNLMRTFTAGDSAVELVPKQPGSESKAKDATEFLNYVFYQQNNGFQILQTWFTDAMLSKNGFVMVWWDEHEVEEREEYQGLSDLELQLLLDSDEVEPLEHSSYQDEQQVSAWQQQVTQIQQQYQQAAMQAQQQGQPAPPEPELPPEPMLHDVAVKRVKQSGRVRIENIPPENFMISRDALTLEDARFCAYQVQRTRSYLQAAGYQNVDKLVADDSIVAYSAERVERQQQNNGWAYEDQRPSGDRSQDLLWISYCYIQADRNGDGIAEWLKVVKCADQILEIEECDGHPFVDVCAIPLPHQFFGQSIADMAMDAQKVKTAVMRSMLDNLYLQVNGRYFAVENQCNLDDLMTSRPGGIVRVRQPGMVGRLDQSMAGFGEALKIAELLESEKENRTGFTRYSQGTDANNLNKTATGINILTNRADLRLELVARNFAERGVKQLFAKILKLVCQHQDNAAQIRVAGAWIEMNPREWRDKFELSINVGLGTNNKDQQVQQMQMLLGIQQQMMGIGLVQPQNIYASLSKLSESMGFKAPEQFFVDPSKQQVQMPPNPQAQAEMAKMQAMQQQKQVEIQAQMQLEQAKTQNEIQRFQAETQIELQKAQLQAEIELQKAQLQANTQIKIAKIKQAITGQNDPELMTQTVSTLLAQITDAISSINAPKQVIRDQSGKVVGVQPIEMPRANQMPVMYDEEGELSEIDDRQNLASLLDQLSNEIASINKPKQVIRDQSGKVVGVQSIEQ
jgi:hypothetical protein